MFHNIPSSNEIITACIAAYEFVVVGQTMEAIEADMMGFYHKIINETQLRWLGPEKGVSQMACGAILNAVWDLLSKMAGKPLWKYVADMEPEQLVECIDFKYVCGEDAEGEERERMRREVGNENGMG